jgi:hypothetical protein
VIANGRVCKISHNLKTQITHKKEKKKKLSACRGEGSSAGLQLRVRFVPVSSLLRCWLCQGLHWLASVFLKPDIGEVM